jgi:hypothetical protein
MVFQQALGIGGKTGRLQPDCFLGVHSLQVFFVFFVAFVVKNRRPDQPRKPRSQKKKNNNGSVPIL